MVVPNGTTSWDVIDQSNVVPLNLLLRRTILLPAEGVPHTVNSIIESKDFN